MNICYATFNSLPDLSPYKTGPREEGGSESDDFYVKYTCDTYIQIEEEISSQVWTGLESLFSITSTTAIKVGDKSVSPLHLRGGVRLLIRLIYFPFPRIIAFAFLFVTLLNLS